MIDIEEVNVPEQSYSVENTSTLGEASHRS